MRRGATDGRRWILLAAIVASLLVPASAGAADRLFGTSGAGGQLYAINLDGSGSGTVLSTAPTTPTQPFGLALDPATNGLYWTDQAAATVSRVALDGSGGNVTRFTAGQPGMVAIDPASNSIYWPEFTLDRIMRGNLDGTGVPVAIVSGGLADGPRGIAIDPASNSLYWTNFLSNTVVRANLDGSGAAVIGSGSNGPAGIAIDPTNNSLYWANTNNSRIIRANLDGTAAAALPIIPGAVNVPTGIAVDPDTNRIYWANSGNNTIFGASGGGAGAAALGTGSVTLNTPIGLAILKAPSSAGLPIVTGGGTAGDVLTCAPDFAADLPGSQLYQRPTTVGFQWSLDGSDLGGETNATITTAAGGDYACRVSGTNLAGTAQAVSAAHAVSGPPSPPPPPSPSPLGLPIIASLSPASGPADGGTVVTIGGAGFGSVSQVLFGDVPAVFTVNRYDRITAIAPPRAPGVVRVSVQSVRGTSPPTAAGAFVYLAEASGEPSVQPTGALTPFTPPRVRDGSIGRCVVPRVIGMTWVGAERRIRAAGCRLGHVSQRGSRHVRVVAQSPAPGRDRPAGTYVAIRLR